MNKLKRMLCLVLYYGITKHLPEHSMPRGALWCKLREYTAGPLLRHRGKDIAINRGAHFGKGDKFSLGDRSSLGIDARVVGDVSIGADVGMAHNVFITASNRYFPSTEQTIISQGLREDDPVVIEDDVLILANVVILPGVRVGGGSIIGASAVVTKNVPRWSIVVGNPARIVKFRKDPEPNAFNPDMTPVSEKLLKLRP